MYTALLLHFDGAKGSTTFTDATGRHTGAANGAAQIDTTFSQWGNASLSVDGNAGSYASFTGNLSDFNLTGDFTIEFTVRPISYGASGFICFHSDPSLVLTNRYWVQVDTAGIAHWAINGVFVIDSTATVPLNTETHIAVSRVGSTTQLFINGISQGSLAGTDNLAIGTAFVIGARGDGTVFNLNGNIDEFRVINGYGVYTSNFSIPAGPFSTDVTQLRPPFYFYYRPIDTLQRSWTWSYNLLLIGKDRLPTGDQFFDLSPIAPPQILPRSWTWNYNLNLIAKDALIAGEQVFDLPPIGLPYPISLRTWISFTPLAIIPSAVPFFQTDWPLPGRPTPIQQSWAFSLLTTTLLPLPYGDQLYDLAPRSHPEPRVRVWTWNYNLNLIGQDTLTVGEQISDLVPRPYPEPATRTWTAWFNLNLIGRDRLLVGKQVYDLAPIAPPQILPRSWTWSYNLNLTGQDQLPTGARSYDLAPVGPFYSTQLRTWIYFTPPVAPFAFPFNQYDWPNPKPYPEPATRTWAASYNLNLIAQDRMTVGEQVYDLTPIVQPQILPRSWVQNLLLSTLLTPIGDQWWERPPLGPIQPLREWAWRYNLNLVGQDVLPAGNQRYELTPPGYIYPVQLRTWLTFRPLALDFVAGAIPYLEYNWPNPNRGPQQPDRFYSASFPLVLIGKDAMVPGKPFYDLPPRPYPEPATRTWTFSPFAGFGLRPPVVQFFDLTIPAPQRSIQLNTWTATYNYNLIGQDITIVGDQYWELPPRDHLRLLQLRSWFERFNPNLAGKDKLPVGIQYFEFPRPPLQPTSIFVASYNKNLTGQDRLPTGDQYFDLSPKGPITPRDIINWISSVNLALNFPAPPPVPLPPGALVYDLAPTDRRYSNFRDFISGCNLCIGIPVTPPIPPPVPVGPQFVHNPGNEWQIYDRIREPGPLGWR